MQTTSDPTTSLLTGFLDDTAQLARKAGEAILEIYEQADRGITTKSDDSPLTQADLESHRIIAAGLQQLSAEIPVLSEEGADAPFERRRGWSRFWLVDPLDGTKEFIRRNGEFTVNIALIEGGAPVLGIVHAPTLDRTFSGALGVGAWCYERDTTRAFWRPPAPATGT